MKRSAILIVAVCLIACSESKSPKTKPQVSVDDMSALEESSAKLQESDQALSADLKAIKEELAKLKADLEVTNDSAAQNFYQVIADTIGVENKADEALAKIEGVKNRLSALEAITTSSIPRLWLYDGQKTRRAPVVSIQTFADPFDSMANVLFLGHVVAQYDLYLISDTPFNWNLTVHFYYESNDCTGQPYVFPSQTHPNWLARGSGAALTAFYVSPQDWDAPSPKTYHSIWQSTFCETNVVPGGVTENLVKPTVIGLISDFTYPSPLTVGP